MKRILGVLTLATALALGGTGNSVNQGTEQLAERVRHELVMLPWLSVYDDLSFQVDPDGNVTLSGQVIRPTLRTDAERIVKRIEGVAQVENRIEVLPLSPFDNGVRLRVARAVYGAPSLNRYALGARPPIRIIVKNGNVVLKGVVLNEGDKNIAGIRANGVSGVFSVINELQVENRAS